MEWIDHKKYRPHVDVPFLVKTGWGEVREAIFYRNGMGYVLTDCTHPLQNCHLGDHDILGWKFKNIQDFVTGKYSINHYQMEKDGEEMIKQALKKQPHSFWNRIQSLLKQIQ